MNKAKAKDIALGEVFNHQTYECETQGLVTGDEVSEDEVDYGVLNHYCQKETVTGKTCCERAYYVGFRATPASKPERSKRYDRTTDSD